MVKNKILYKIYLLLFINIVFSDSILSLNQIYSALNINKVEILDSIVIEEKLLTSIGLNSLGKEIFLSKECAKSWIKMQSAANKDSITISILSGFRSYYKQYTIINNKQREGLELNEILKENKLPGLSQHHSGNAIDIISNNHKLSVDFEKTRAYSWLHKHAHEFGFYLEYRRGNKDGIMFEPWHWYFKG